MGCDIHCYLEKKTDNKNEIEESSYSYSEWEIVSYDKIYNHRNSNLFAILANVRNNRELSGLPTEATFEPISKPRGLPKDVSFIVGNLSEAYGVDGHSHSYLTLKEILDYDWERKKRVLNAIVDEENYIRFKENKYPYSFCYKCMGPKTKEISNEEMEAFISGKTKKDNNLKYVTVITFEEKYSESCKQFFNDTIPKLKDMVAEFCTEEEIINGKKKPIVDTAENLRIVFWFDN